MGFRFYRRVKIAPGVHLNFTKTGASVSIGPKGAKLTTGKRGTRITVGMPGTGMFYTEKLDKKTAHPQTQATESESHEHVLSGGPLRPGDLPGHPQEIETHEHVPGHEISWGKVFLIIIGAIFALGIIGNLLK